MIQWYGTIFLHGFPFFMSFDSLHSRAHERALPSGTDKAPDMDAYARNRSEALAKARDEQKRQGKLDTVDPMAIFWG
ncbi:MAG TPA: hypothetical protein PK765_00090 [bacterium]|nr:hypothetical protein [bacterium]